MCNALSNHSQSYIQLNSTLAQSIMASSAIQFYVIPYIGQCIYWWAITTRFIQYIPHELTLMAALIHDPIHLLSVAQTFYNKESILLWILDYIHFKKQLFSYNNILFNYSNVGLYFQNPVSHLDNSLIKDIFRQRAIIY